MRSAVHWLDAGVLIEAHRRAYPLDRFQSFWRFIDEQLAAGTIRMPRVAFGEIVGFNDDLAQWCKPRKSNGLCVNETRPVQERYGEIVQYVYNKHARTSQHAREFLDGADGWVIAYAYATDGIVVTMESDSKYKSKVKIPTVAKHFDVKCYSTFDMLRVLNFSEKK